MFPDTRFSLLNYLFLVSGKLSIEHYDMFSRKKYDIPMLHAYFTCASKLAPTIAADYFTYLLWSFRSFKHDSYWLPSDLHLICNDQVDAMLGPELRAIWREFIVHSFVGMRVNGFRVNSDYFAPHTDFLLLNTPKQKREKIAELTVSVADSAFTCAINVELKLNAYDLSKFASHITSHLGVRNQVYHPDVWRMKVAGYRDEILHHLHRYVVERLIHRGYMNRDYTLNDYAFGGPAHFKWVPASPVGSSVNDYFAELTGYRLYLLSPAGLFFLTKALHRSRYWDDVNETHLITVDSHQTNQLKFMVGSSLAVESTARPLTPLELVKLENVTGHLRNHPAYLRALSDILKSATKNKQLRKTMWDYYLIYDFDNATRQASSYYYPLASLALMNHAVKNVLAEDQVVLKGVGVESKRKIDHLLISCLEIAAHAYAIYSKLHANENCYFLRQVRLDKVGAAGQMRGKTGVAYLITDDQLYCISDLAAPTYEAVASTVEQRRSLIDASKSFTYNLLVQLPLEKLNEVNDIVAKKFHLFRLAQSIAAKFSPVTGPCSLVLKTGDPMLEGAGSKHAFYVLLEKSADLASFRIIIFNAGGQGLIPFHTKKGDEIDVAHCHKHEIYYAAATGYIPFSAENRKFLAHYIYRVINLEYSNSQGATLVDSRRIFLNNMANVYLLSTTDDTLAPFGFSGFGSYRYTHGFRVACKDLTYSAQWNSNCTVYNLIEALLGVLRIKRYDDAGLIFLDYLKRGVDLLISAAKPLLSSREEELDADLIVQKVTRDEISLLVRGSGNGSGATRRLSFDIGVAAAEADVVASAGAGSDPSSSLQFARALISSSLFARSSCVVRPPAVGAVGDALVVRALKASY